MTFRVTASRKPAEAGPSPRAGQHWDVIDPPDTVYVEQPRTVLYTADGTPLKRQIGYKP